MKPTIIGFLLLFCLSSCFTIKPVEFIKVDNVVSSMNDSIFEIAFKLNMHNPNNWSLRLSEIESDVLIGNQFLGIAKLEKVVKLSSNNDFSVPIKATSSIEDLSSFATIGLGLLLGNQSTTATIKGHITLKKFIFRKKYPFEYKERIDARLLESLF